MRAVRRPWFVLVEFLLTTTTRGERTCNPGSAVVEALEVGGGIDDVARGKDIDLLGNGLAVITTVIRILVIHWRHC